MKSQQGLNRLKEKMLVSNQASNEDQPLNSQSESFITYGPSLAFFSEKSSISPVTQKEAANKHSQPRTPNIVSKPPGSTRRIGGKLMHQLTPQCTTNKKQHITGGPDIVANIRLILQRMENRENEGVKVQLSAHLGKPKRDTPSFLTNPISKTREASEGPRESNSDLYLPKGIIKGGKVIKASSLCMRSTGINFGGEGKEKTFNIADGRSKDDTREDCEVVIPAIRIAAPRTLRRSGSHVLQEENVNSIYNPERSWKIEGGLREVLGEISLTNRKNTLNSIIAKGKNNQRFLIRSNPHTIGERKLIRALSTQNIEI